MENLLRRVRLSVSMSAAIALAIGLVFTALLFTSIRRVETQTRKVEFREQAMLRIGAVANGLSGAVEQLLVLNELYRTIGTVSREQFQEFTAPLLARYPEIHALSFQRTVPHAERERYEAAMRKRFPNFTITEYDGGVQRPAAERDRYNVVEFIEPKAGNEAAFGLDTSGNPENAQARALSRRTGRAAATGLLSLAQHPGLKSGFLVLAPVYLRGAPRDTPALRERAVVGETAAVFRIDRLIHTLLGKSGFLDTPGISTSIYAAPSAQLSQLAFQNGARVQPAPLRLIGPEWLLYDRAPAESATFEVAGSTWYIEVAQAPQSFAAQLRGSLVVLVSGVLISLLAAAYVYNLVTRRAVIERVARERTSELRSDNQRLSENLALCVRAEKSLRLREKVIEVSSNAILICSAEGPDYAIEYVNPAFESITGYAAADVVGRSLKTLQGASRDHQNLEEISAALREQREGHAVLRNYRKDGTGYWNDLYIAPVRDEHGAISNFVVAQYDISAVMRFEAELEYQAQHDSLTGLANRNLLQTRLANAIAGAAGNGGELWVVFVDLDRFKFVNDTLGHEAGDALLKTLAERLRLAVRDCDTVARVGGDEFMLVLPENTGDGAGMAVLHKVMDSVAAPLMIESHEFFLTCSIGVALYPADGASPGTLTKHADIAMYRAKELGRNAIAFYNPAMNQRTLERLEIEADLRHALDRGQFVLHYQPQVNMETGAIVGMEALLRWMHPVHGMIAPTRFITLAEEMGLILPIGDWVVRTACEQTMRWHREGLGALRVAVNLSARQFTQKGLVLSIAAVLRETGLPPACLELELTESMVMGDVDSAITILRDLKALGIKIAIDDFGTGYSSLSYLRRFPIDVLKIDQSFVSDITLKEDDAAIVSSIISLAHSLRLKVIAEGVETGEQLAFLRARGCNEVQGYFYSRPVPAMDFSSLLQRHSERMAHAEV